MQIFLGCPHRSKSTEDLEDELFSLLCLPGPPMKKRILQKIRHLARQIERVNLEFLETNVLDRAVVLNVISEPQGQGQTDVTNEPQVMGPVAKEGKAAEHTRNPALSAFFPFSPYTCTPCHNLGFCSVSKLSGVGHAELVRNPKVSNGIPWAALLVVFFNQVAGYSKFSRPLQLTKNPRQQIENLTRL